MPLVTGRTLHPDGTPAVGVHVYAYPADAPRRRAETHTDRSGRWHLMLPPGCWQVREAKHEAHTVDVDAEPVDVTAPTATAAGVDPATDVARLVDRRAALNTTGPAAPPDDVTRLLERRAAGDPDVAAVPDDVMRLVARRAASVDVPARPTPEVDDVTRLLTRRTTTEV